ncbi:unnamed protein product [Bursaphelenchus xylophilus]|uniref:(pine wood nematode) hypothetical protein n=1 Tax=Bursaphelenchus xylophilus TaxID=6326 RepID=A0A1I7RYS5_BURXY|nr:unnamed protein product [Bursaphelenchus xylophilus]CAG9092307.1 unnamed protein product [Bursaphelenchus xylophilus]
MQSFVPLTVIALFLLTKVRSDANDDKCAACLELFELLDDLNSHQNVEQTNFSKNTEFACNILQFNLKTPAIYNVCVFVKTNIPNIYNYVRTVDQGVKPKKHCQVFFRCKFPEVIPRVPQKDSTVAADNDTKNEISSKP